LHARRSMARGEVLSRAARHFALVGCVICSFAVAADAGASVRQPSAFLGRRLAPAFSGQRWVELEYSLPVNESTPVETWYNMLTPTHSAEDSTFAVLNDGTAFLGLQQVEGSTSLLGFEGMVVFSIWDAGCDHVFKGRKCAKEGRAELVECGSDFVCSRFDDQGTGMRSYMRFKWSMQRSYSFVARASEVGPGVTQYEAYFHANELQGWVLMAKVQVKQGTRPQPLRSISSFVEHSSPRGRGETRWAEYGPAFVGSLDNVGDWVQVRSATSRHSPQSAVETARTHGNVTAQGALWGLGMGSDVQSDALAQEALHVWRAFSYPLELQAFDELQRAGNLPSGCTAGTCLGTLITDWFKARITLQGLAGTLALACSFFSCSCGLMLCQLCRRTPSVPECFAAKGKLEALEEAGCQKSVQVGPCLLTGASLKQAETGAAAVVATEELEKEAQEPWAEPGAAVVATEEREKVTQEPWAATEEREKVTQEFCVTEDALAMV